MKTIKIDNKQMKIISIRIAKNIYSLAKVFEISQTKTQGS